MKLGLDVDGVFAEFHAPYSQLITSKTGIVMPSEPSEWHFERMRGVSRDQEKEVWEHINDSPDWWLRLPLRDDARGVLTRLNSHHNWDIYFITARPDGWKTKWQTETWLRSHGFEHPTVLMTANKAGVANMLELDVLVEDRGVNLRGFEGQKVLVRRPYNADERDHASVVIDSVQSLWEVL